MDAFNSVKSGLGSFFSGVGDVAGDVWSGLSSGVGDLFSSGTQPTSGSPGATGAVLSQGTPDVNGMDYFEAGADLSPSAFAASAGPDINSSSALSQAIASTNGAGESGGFDWGSLVKNAVPLGMLGYSIWRGTQEPGEIGDLRALANDAAMRSGTLNAGAMEAMQGNLPGGAMASLDQALEAAKARIRSNYAALGMTGSSPEAQDLAYAEIAASAQAFDMGQSMATTGFNAAAGADSLSAALYQAILQSETARGTAMGDALAEFAAGLVDSDVTIGGGG